MATNIKKALRSASLLLLLLLLFMKFSTSLGDQRESFVYNGFKGAQLKFAGLAKILPNGLLQLTDFSTDQIGHAFHPSPLNFNSSSSSSSSNVWSFSTTFVFAIIPESGNQSGQGIAFTISPHVGIEGAYPAEYFGLFNTTNNGNDSNHIFAVELDTGRSVQFGDIDANHVGIDVNGLRSIKSASAAYFSSKEGKNKRLALLSGDRMQIWIDYNGVKKQIDVALAPFGEARPTRPLISTPLDLSTVLLDHMYVGFSSSNGALDSFHYVLGWSFSRNGEAQALDLSHLPSLPRRRRGRPRRKQGLVIGLSVGMVMVVLATVIAGLLYLVRKKRYEEIQEDWEQEFGPHRFSYKILYKATKGFKEAELLGSGGFGKVYKGTLPSSNLQVAIKRVSHNSNQGMRQFIAEIASLGRLRHRNMVQLLGYCRRRGELLLVYDYMPNGSLEKFLHGSDQTIPKLNWSQRYRILRGVASALLYLHQEWEQVVLHRDVKASNVLLDANFNGRLGDFGLARLYDHGANTETTHVAGTIGYIAPELSRTGKATTMTDVFAFGAFMLEVACGRRPIEPQEQPEKVILVDWVLDCWRNGNILEARDSCLGDDYAVEEMELVLKLGLLCSHTVAGARPSMRQVVRYFDGDATLPEITFGGLPIGMATRVTDEGFSSYVASNSSTEAILSGVTTSTLSD